MRLTLLLSCLLAFVPTCPVLAADTPVPFEMPKRGICAHRGASQTHPENTIAAFRQALLLGVQMIEFDVALTKDQQLVILHDSTVDRTTDGHGNVSELTFEQIRKLDAGSWKHSKFKGARIPTLDETLSMMPENVWLNVHLKGGPKLAAACTRTIAEHDRLHQCFLACDAASAAAALKVNPQILICNMERQGNSTEYVEATIAAEADFIQLWGGDDVAPTHIEALNAADVQSNFCCSNVPEKTERLLERGVHFVLSDNIADAMKVSDRLGIERLTPVYRKSKADGPKATPVFKDGEAQIVPAFEDPDQWIHHDLWVETEFDSDGNGRPDRMHVSVARPRQTDSEGLKVAVVYNSSPYFSGTASGTRDFFWNPEQELGSEPPKHADPPSITQQSRRLIISRRHQKDWVPRGFAVVHSASPGTGLSEGCPTIGGDNESLAPKAVVDWLCGRAKGYTTATGSQEVTAYWSTGSVGMTGTSYNGTIPLAAATTGVDGLKAIIPVAPNTSYYHYYRSNGLVRHPGGYIGEDIDVLYNYINSGDAERRKYCDCNVRDQEMAKGFDRVTGDYNDFWAGRDYLNDLKPFKAALLMSHGFNDWNVMPEHSIRIYKAVQAKGVPVQLYVHQGGHGGPPPIKMMNRWFTRFLYDIPNGVEEEAKAWIVRENEDRQKPTAYPDYPHPQAETVSFYPAGEGKGRGTLTADRPDDVTTQTLIDSAELLGRDLARSERSENRLLFVTPELKEPLHLSGTAKMQIRLSSNRPAANLSVWLVSLPWQEGGDVKIYDNIITRGWADPQNAASISESRPLVPGEFVELTFDLQPDDHIVPAGQQIGLMIFSSDREFTLWPKAGTELTIDLSATRLDLPVVHGRKALSWQPE